MWGKIVNAFLLLKEGPNYTITVFELTHLSNRRDWTLADQVLARLGLE